MRPWNLKQDLLLYFDTKSLNRSVVVMDSSDLNIFQVNIDFVIFGFFSSFLRFKFNFDAANAFLCQQQVTHDTVTSFRTIVVRYGTFVHPQNNPFFNFD